MLNLKKALSLFLSLTCAVSLGITNPKQEKTVLAAATASSVTASDVKQAYISYLLKYENKWNLAAANAGTDNTSAMIGIRDMNKDGLPELLISLGNSDRLYTYLNGKVTLVAKTSKKQNYAFCSSRNLVCRYYYSSDSVFSYTYYTLKNGKLTEKYKLNSRQVSGKTEYVLNGARISTKEYQSFKKNYAIKRLYTVPLDRSHVMSLLSPGFSKSKYTIYVGESIQLPLFSDDSSDIHFASKKTSIAYFKDSDDRKEGVITGKAAGTTTISATADNRTYKCSVTVVEPDSLLSRPTGLAESTKIKEDLDGDGMYELVYWKATYNEATDTSKILLQVDDQKVTIEGGLASEVYLIDIDPQDQYQELYVESTGCSDCTVCSVFYRFDGNRLTEYAKMSENMESCHYSLIGITKNKHFRYQIDTPYFSEYLGMYHATGELERIDNGSGRNTNLTLLNGTCITTNSWRTYRYTPLTKLSVKTAIGGTKTAFTLKPGSACYLHEVYRQNGQLYIKLENSDGKTGWLAVGSKKIFYDSDFNLWG